MLAVGSDRGVVLWDLARGVELAFLPIGSTRNLLFEASGDLLTLTAGSLGVQRWPVQLDPVRGEFRIGPPRRLPLPVASCRTAEDRSGRIVAAANFGETHVLTPDRAFQVGPLDDCRYVAVSPDGKWLATGSHGVSGAQVWQIRDGTRVADLKVEGLVGVAFSPDGKWLMTSPSPCRLWAVGTWEEARRISGEGLCFSPDGRLLLVQETNKALRLVETETGRTVARFESPDLALCSSKAPHSAPTGRNWLLSPMMARPSTSGTCGQSGSTWRAWASTGTRRLTPRLPPHSMPRSHPLSFFRPAPTRRRFSSNSGHSRDESEVGQLS